MIFFLVDCASGLEYNAASGKCEFCDIGYYRNRDIRTQTQCQLCPLDKITRSEGGTDISDCNIGKFTHLSHWFSFFHIGKVITCSYKIKKKAKTIFTNYIFIK